MKCTQAVQRHRKLTKDPRRIAAALLEAGSENSFVGGKDDKEGMCGWGTLARLLLSKCENLHFYLLIYLTDRALKQPSINKRHVGNE